MQEAAPVGAPALNQSKVPVAMGSAPLGEGRVGVDEGCRLRHARSLSTRGGQDGSSLTTFSGGLSSRRPL